MAGLSRLLSAGGHRIEPNRLVPLMEGERSGLNGSTFEAIQEAIERVDPDPDPSVTAIITAHLRGRVRTAGIESGIPALVRRYLVEGAEVDADLAGASRQALLDEVVRLRDAIRADARVDGHDRCWYRPELWGLVPGLLDEVLGTARQVPGWPDFMAGCLAYRRSLDGGDTK